MSSQAVTFLRRDGERLAEAVELLDEDGFFAGLGDAERAVDADDVAGAPGIPSAPRSSGATSFCEIISWMRPV